MADEGSQLMMAELVLQEKELNEKLRKVEQAMQEPVSRLRRAKAILDKAKAAFEAQLAAVRPLQSEKTLIEGELEILADKKSKLRQEARMAESGGIRPGTQAFVEQMNELAGDPEQAAAKKAAQELEVDDALAALKARAQSEG